MSSGGGGEVKQKSTLDPAQQELMRTSANFLNPRVGQGATPLPFDTFAQPNELFDQAFQQFSQSFQDPSRQQYTQENLRNIIEGTGGYETDIPGISREYTENVITPTARALEQTLGLDVRNQLNQPGRLFASDVGEQTGQAITRELSQSTLPFLSQAIESERQRGFQSSEALAQQRLPALQLLRDDPMQQFQQAFSVAESERGLRQQELRARAQEFLRLTPEADPFLQMAMGFSTTPTVENIAFQEQDRTGQLLGAGAGILTGMATGETGFFA